MGIKPLFGSDSEYDCSPRIGFERSHNGVEESSEEENCLGDSPFRGESAQKRTPRRNAISKLTKKPKHQKGRKPVSARPKKPKKKDCIKSLEQSGRKILYGKKKDKNWQGFAIGRCKYQPEENNFMYLPKFYRDKFDLPPSQRKYCSFCKLEPCIVKLDMQETIDLCQQGVDKGGWSMARVRACMVGGFMRQHCNVFNRTYHRWMETLPCVGKFVARNYPDAKDIPGPATDESSSEESAVGRKSGTVRNVTGLLVTSGSDSDSDASLFKPIPMIAARNKRMYGC